MIFSAHHFFKAGACPPMGNKTRVFVNGTWLLDACRSMLYTVE